MQCSDTGGQMPAIHVSTGALELAQALVPYIDVIQEKSQGNGDIIIPLRGGVIDAIQLELRGKLRKIIRFVSRER